MKESLFQSEHLQIDYIHSSVSSLEEKGLVFFFNARGCLSLNDFGQDGRLLLERGFDLVLLDPRRKAGYQRLSRDIIATVQQSLSRISGGMPYVRRVALGSSVAGYRAIQYAGALGVDRVVVISPRFGSKEELFSGASRLISGSLDTFRSSGWTGSDPDYLLVFDPQDRYDDDHAASLAAVMPEGRLFLHRMRFAGHPVDTCLREIGVLGDFCLALLKDGRMPILSTRQRRRSHRYLLNKATFLKRRERYQFALCFISDAIRAGDQRPGSFHLKSILCEKLKQYTEAVEAARISVERDPENPKAWIQLSRMLLLQGYPNDALIKVREGVTKFPDFTALHELQSRIALVLDKAGAPRSSSASGMGRGKLQPVSLDPRDRVSDGPPNGRHGNVIRLAKVARQSEVQGAPDRVDVDPNALALPKEIDASRRIELVNVTKFYGTRTGPRVVLSGISFGIMPGEKIGILGRNGSGKSTLIRIIGGVESPSQGYVYRGMSISWPLAFSGGFQGGLTGLDNLRFICRIYDVSVDAVMPFVEDFAELGVYLREPIRSYSSGMRARLAFAISMAIEFDCFLIDEVTAVGDSRFRERCEIELFQKRKDRAMIMVSHSPRFIREHCEVVFVLNQGRVTRFDDAEQAYDYYAKQIG